MTKLEAIRGDDFTQPLTITDTNGNPFDLTGCTLWWTLKRATDGSTDDTSAIARLFWQDAGSSDGIAVDFPTLGAATVTMGALLTAGLSQYGGYRYDLQVEDSVGRITTVDSGPLIATNDTTRRTTTP